MIHFQHSSKNLLLFLRDNVLQLGRTLLHKNLPILPVLPATNFTGKSVNSKNGKPGKFIYRRNSSSGCFCLWQGGYLNVRLPCNDRERKNFDRHYADGENLYLYRWTQRADIYSYFHYHNFLIWQQRHWLLFHQII